MMTLITDKKNPGKVNTSAATASGYGELVGLALRLVFPLLVLLFAMAWATRGQFTGTKDSSFLPAVSLLVSEFGWVCLWLLPAAGFGVALQRFIFREDSGSVLSCRMLALGIAVLFFIDQAGGALGLLQAGGGVPAYLITLGGSALIFLPKLRRGNPEAERGVAFFSRTLVVFSGLGSVFALALGVLLTAALSTPGYLWRSEFGGFDALSYHLQLPREWLALGRIVPVEHNVYSFLPSAMESAYYHLAILRAPFKGNYGDGMQAAVISAQLLHAMLTIITALTLVELFRKYTGKFSATAWLLGAAFVAVPWITVVGSLAYNEIPTLLFFVAALSFVFPGTSWQRGCRAQLALGFLLGSAVAAKLTAVGFVIIPVVALVVLLLVTRGRTVFSSEEGEEEGEADFSSFGLVIGRTLGLIAVGGLVALAPYAIRNFVATDFTNPFFPFATTVFGSAHWTTEQVERFNQAHFAGATLTLGERLQRFVEMAVVHVQWAYLFPLAVVTGIGGLVCKRIRRELLVAFSLLIVQLLFWFFFTHQQSRFLIPCSIPLSLLLALPLLQFAGHSKVFYRWLAFTAAGLFLALNLTTTWRVYAAEGAGFPAALIDGLPLRVGTEISLQNQQALAEQDPIVFLNINEAKLKSGKVYLLGDATPLYLNPPQIYHTTWDTSPLGQVIREFPDTPEEWGPQLSAQFGIRYLLINWDELRRYIEQDQWYDPAVTLEAVQELRESERLRLIRQWPPRYELLELPGTPGGE